MAEQKESPAPSDQPAEATSEEAQKALLDEKTAEVAAAEPVKGPPKKAPEALQGKPVKVASQKAAAPPVSPAPSAKKRLKGPGTAETSKAPRGNPLKSPPSVEKPDAKIEREKKSKKTRKPVAWDWTLVCNFMLLLANIFLLYPALRSANAERAQADLALQEAKEAKAEAATLRERLDLFSKSLTGELERLRTTVGITDHTPPSPPPPENLIIVPQSFSCSVREDGSRMTLMNSEICYNLRFNVQNNGAGNRRVKVRASFAREGRSWTCESGVKTVAFDRSELFSIPLLSCFGRLPERRNGDIDFSLQMESVPE